MHPLRQSQGVAGLTLNQTLIIFDGITGFVYLGIQAALKRWGQEVPARWDRAYALFGLSLMMAVLVNGEIRLLM